MKATPQTIEKFNKTVIEALWGMPYEEAVLIELRNGGRFIGGFDNNRDEYWEKEMGDIGYTIEYRKEYEEYWACIHYDGGFDFICPIIKSLGFPVTLSRVMQALDNNKICLDCVTGKSKYCKSGWHNFAENYEKYAYVINICNWKLTINNQTATSEDQSEECLQKLIELLNEQHNKIPPSYTP